MVTDSPRNPGQGAQDTSPVPLRWFVTGASGGLGRHLVAHALSAGDHVVATARKPQALADLADRYGRHLVVKTLDVAQPADVDDVVTDALSEFGHVDVVVNNAGYSIIGATEEMTDDQVHHQLATMLHAPIQITRAFLESMRIRGSGRFIQISSVGGQVAYPVSSIYHASKWGLEGFSEAVSKEVADFDIHFTIVEPGGMRTGFGANGQFTPETTAYKPTAVGAFRRVMANAGDEVYIGDPAKFAVAIFDTTRTARPPLRLALGTDSYDEIHHALSDRLTALEAQRDIARSVGFDDGTAGKA
jgi:NAD(P)-dependent dehydrogenase (short-subunit alcohol dehydrogenase family)